MRDTLTEIAGASLVLVAFVLLAIGASALGWWMAVLVAGVEALAAGAALIVVANRRAG